MVRQTAVMASGGTALSFRLATSGPVDHLDHGSYQQFWGGKIGIDATRKWPEEGYTRGWPPEAVMSAEVRAAVDRRWKEYGL